MSSPTRVFLSSILLLSIGCTVESELEAPVSDSEPDAGIIYWETEAVSEEAHSTHLWIVERAVDILARHTDSPAAAAAYARMNDSKCRSRWHQGLFDADYKAPHHDGYWDLYPGASEWRILVSGASWKSHFYDPDTGENYKGERSPVAKGRALEHAAAAEAAFAAGDASEGCYRLGLSLHYMTDITQPMHTTNFTATDWPLRLHSHLEAYAMELHDDYVRPDWSEPTRATTARLLQTTAKASKAQWPVVFGALEDAYAARCVPLDEYWFDHEECWRGDAAVTDAVGASLWSAQEATAHYLTTLEL